MNKPDQIGLRVAPSLVRTLDRAVSRGDASPEFQT
jgi:hypothetical protein